MTRTRPQATCATGGLPTSAPAPNPASTTPGFRRQLSLVAILCAVLLSNGCTPPTVDDAPAVLPTYRQLVQRYNANIAGLDRLWCAAAVEINWRDEDGKDHYQQGDGNVMVVLPDQLALSVSKGQTLLWVGCDRDRYWLIDLRDKDERKAYFGRHERVGASAGPDLPTAIPVRRLPLLLGLLTLDPQPTAETTPTVEYRKGAYVIRPPEVSARIRIDPKTALPVSVELLDPDGKPVVVSSLAKPGRVKRRGVARNAWPWIMTRIELRTPDSGDDLTLHLSRMTDARDSSEERKQKAMAKAFDFRYLAGIYDGTEIVDLDSQPASP